MSIRAISAAELAEQEVKTLASSDDRIDKSQQTDAVSQKAFFEGSKQNYTTLADLETEWENLKKQIKLQAPGLYDILIKIVLDYLLPDNPENIKFFLNRKLSPRISIPQTTNSRFYSLPEDEFDTIMLKLERVEYGGSQVQEFLADHFKKEISWNGKVIADVMLRGAFQVTYYHRLVGIANKLVAIQGKKYFRDRPQYFRYTLFESLQDYGEALRIIYMKRESTSVSKSQKLANVEARVASELADRTGALYRKFLTTLAHGRKDFKIQGTWERAGNDDTYTLSVYELPLSAQPGQGSTPAEAYADAWEKAYLYVTQKIHELTFQEFVILENEFAKVAPKTTFHQSLLQQKV